MATNSTASTSSSSPNPIVGHNPIWSAIRALPTFNFARNQNRTQLLVALGGLCGLCCIVGLGSYYLLFQRPRPFHRQHEEQQEDEEEKEEPRFKAEQRKAQGIDAYKQKRYEEAIEIFGDAANMVEGEEGVEGLVCRELRASCQNNIAACYDALQNLEKCIEHCTAAIELKPDYVKALIRRAKCFQQLDRTAEAMDDYMDLVTIETVGAISPHQFEQIHAEMDKIIDAQIAPQLPEMLQARIGQAQRIPQSLVAPWHFFNLAQNDPLLAMARAIDAKNAKIESASGLEAALIALAQRKYDQIAGLASAVVDQPEVEGEESAAGNGALEKAQAVLLAARFLHYQALDEAAQTMADRFVQFWEKLDEAQKLANKDLHVAHIVLQMQMVGAEWANNGNGGNGNESTGGGGASPSHRLSPANKQRLSQMAEEALRINPKNVDPLLHLGFILMCAEQPDEAVTAFQRARKLDKEHAYVKFYEKCASLLSAFLHLDISRIRHCFYEMERAIKDASSQHPPPGHVLLKMIEAAGQMGLNDVATEFVRLAVQQMPTNPDVIIYAGMMDPIEPQMEKAFEKAAKADPNYWKPRRLLAMVHTKKNEFDEAEREYDAALALARGREELNVLLKERQMLALTLDRSRRGRRIPRAPRAE